METKLNAFKALYKIGMLMIPWMYQDRPPWQADVFKGHIPNATLTEALMSICAPTVEAGNVDAVWKQELLEITEQFDIVRAPVAESFKGLETIDEFLRDPS